MNTAIKKYRKIPYEKRTYCLICENKMGPAVIRLPDFPMTEIYTDKKVKEKVGFVDQSFHFCKVCGHAQIANVIDTGLQYGSAFSYHFRTSESATGRESSDFFAEFLKNVVGTRHFRTIVELGCNDLHLLKSIRSLGDRLIGVDPILKGREGEYADDKVSAIGDFFENVTLQGDVDLVICKDTLEHVSQPKQFMKKIITRANPDALFFFQFPYLETLLESFRFDQVFHQHLNYFSLRSIIFMLEELGCELLEYRINYNLWGSILIAFKKSKRKSKWVSSMQKITEKTILERYKVFQKNMEVTAKRLEYVKGEVLYGYGAALMLPVLSYHLKNDFSSFTCIIDDDKRKEGLYYINLPVSIRTSEKINDIHNSVILITAIASMNNARRILPKLFLMNPKQVIVPLNTL